MHSRYWLRILLITRYFMTYSLKSSTCTFRLCRLTLLDIQVYLETSKLMRQQTLQYNFTPSRHEIRNITVDLFEMDPKLDVAGI